VLLLSSRAAVDHGSHRQNHTNNKRIITIQQKNNYNDKARDQRDKASIKVSEAAAGCLLSSSLEKVTREIPNLKVRYDSYMN
jgi:hypothetical protein